MLLKKYKILKNYRLYKKEVFRLKRLKWPDYVMSRCSLCIRKKWINDTICEKCNTTRQITGWTDNYTYVLC